MKLRAMKKSGNSVWK